MKISERLGFKCKAHEGKYSYSPVNKTRVTCIANHDRKENCLSFELFLSSTDSCLECWLLRSDGANVYFTEEANAGFCYAVLSVL